MTNPESIPSPFMPEDFPPDPGHVGMMHDLNALVKEARNFHFHDKKGATIYPIPKMALVVMLSDIIKKVKLGYYNNPHI